MRRSSVYQNIAQSSRKNKRLASIVCICLYLLPNVDLIYYGVNSIIRYKLRYYSMYNFFKSKRTQNRKTKSAQGAQCIRPKGMNETNLMSFNLIFILQRHLGLGPSAETRTPKAKNESAKITPLPSPQIRGVPYFHQAGSPVPSIFGTMVKSHFGALVSTLWTSSRHLPTTCMSP